MSHKQRAIRITDNHYALPPVGNMKVGGTAFLSEELFEASEENLWDQFVNGASYEGVIGAYLMPDCHSGFGVPIGCVLVTEGTLIQCGSGYDISCGVLYMRVPLSPDDLVDPSQRLRWIREVEKRVATGIGSERPKGMPAFTQAQIDEALLYGAKTLGASRDQCERLFIPIQKGTDLRKIQRAYAKSLPQLGSLGGGNHFIELQAGDDGSVWIMVHCGSRGYGWQTAEHFFYAGAEARGLAPNRREESWLRVDEPVGAEYWAHHNTAANYAIANRFTIAAAIGEATGEVYGVTPEVYYDISHNLIQEETLILHDGTGGTKRGFVHRKGATRAMPGWHPDLVGTKWAETGHPILVPGSMYDGAALMFPRTGAYGSACSVNHGSGRTMGRGAAKRALGPQQDTIDQEMREVRREFAGTVIEGIVSNQPKIPLDECGRVYKSLDAVLGVLEAEKIAKVKTRMYPVANIKGSD